MKRLIFHRGSDRQEHEILIMIDDNSLKIQDIRSKQVAFDRIRINLHVNHRNMYLSLKNNLLFSKKLRFLFILPTEHDIMAMIDGNSLKNQDICFQLFAFDSIRLNLHAKVNNMIFSFKNYLLFSKKHRFSCLSHTQHDIMPMVDDNSVQTRDIRSKLVVFDSIRLTLQVNT